MLQPFLDMGASILRTPNARNARPARLFSTRNKERPGRPTLPLNDRAMLETLSMA
jgi:hypothetical protein